MKEKLIKKFKEIFNRTDGVPYFSPGRVNLIGEYTDFNGGFVFPCALAFGTYGIIALRKDKEIHVYSDTFSLDRYVFNLEDFHKDPNHNWADYIKGVIQGFEVKGYDLYTGFDLYIEGNMPSGAGLSSSASLEMLVAVMFNEQYGFGIDKTNLALIGQYAENKYVGVNSGIMDQFAVVQGQKDKALLLNTNTLEFDQIPLNLGDYQLMVVNTNKKRGLTESKYNERFSECQEALEIVKPLYQVNYLCELTEKELNNVEKLLRPIVFNRVRHVVTEQGRTISSASALKSNRIDVFAKNMIASHVSLKNDFEVTGKELDTLVEISLEQGALGARMTGAGFGGCIVAIVPTEKVEVYKKNTEKLYEEAIGYKPTFYEVSAEDGTHKL